MIEIWRLYKRDWIHMLKVPVGVFLVIALIAIPCLYDWINIKSVWDPYAHTEGILVAITNEDAGASVLGRGVSIGDELEQSLKTNTKLGWVFTNKEEAESGVVRGRYSASILIPSDFSSRLVGIVEGKVDRPEVIYSVNEKINAVAPKVTATGVSSLAEQVNEQFAKAVSSALLTKFEELGVKLEEQLPLIRKIEQGVFELEQKLPAIRQAGQKVLQVERKLPDIREKAQLILEVERALPELDQAALKLQRLRSEWPKAGEAVIAAGGLAERMTELNQALAHVRAIEAALGKLQDEYGKLAAGVSKDSSSSLETITESGKAIGEQEAEEAVGDDERLREIRENVAELIRTMEAHIGAYRQAVGDSTSDLTEKIGSAQNKLEAADAFIRKSLPEAKQGIREMADFVRYRLSEAEAGIHKLAGLVRDDLPQLEMAVKQAADTLRELDEGERLAAMTKLLKGNIEEESEFLAKPVLVKENRMYPIPNYGSAMSPFYGVLSLWVGATLLISLLNPNAEQEEEMKAKSYQLYVGRLATFMTVGLLQALFVTLGDLFILKAYVANPAAFVLFALLVSATFVAITYALVSVFGNVGKGLAILFMVFQFSSSGGTFPIGMSSPFFQALNPFMPFTYAISLLRESVGGVLWETAVRDMAALVGFIALSLVLSLALKQPLSPWIRKSAENAKRTKLIG
ncbi:YhgE/Pip family protein [Paenibacillus sp. GCM10027627]|uniref:YhgE/Pip family protein n=1 Tax=unclassified Paenibacillus TaxID=185978 RepID=UPI00362BAA2F